MAIDGEDGAGAAADFGGAGDLLGGGAGAEAGAGDGDKGDEGKSGEGEGKGGGDPAFLALLSAEGGDADNPSNRDWAKAAGLKDPDHAIKLLRDNMKAARDSGRLTIPGAEAKPEEIAAFHKAIGVPTDAKGYEIKAPDGVKLNDPLIGRLSEAAVKAGLPKAGFESLVGEYIKAQLDDLSASTKALDDEAAAWVKGQGAAKDASLAAINTAARMLKLTPDKMAGLRTALGPKFALDMLKQLGDGMAEDALSPGSTKTRFGIGGAEAKAEMDRLKTDPEFQVKVKIKGSPERARWDRLQEAAAAHQEEQDRQAA